MQTRILGLVGSTGAFALLGVISGGAALAQAGPTGMPGNGSAGSPEAFQFAERKVSIDTDGARLVVVIPKLLKSVGADFVIDSDVKDAIVSSHLTNVKLQTALDVLMRVSDIPVQYKFEKGAYRFSKRVELPAASASPQSLPPGEPVLPPLPTTLQEEIDIHNVQTFDLLRVLNGLFGIPVDIDPTGDDSGLSGHATASGSSGALGQGTFTSRGSASSGSIGGGHSSQNGSGGVIVNVFGHPIRLGNLGH